MNILVDSDCLIGAFNQNDTHHSKATQLLSSTSSHSLYVVNLVLFECATVLSHKVNTEAVNLFYKTLPTLNMNIIPLEKKIEDQAWKIMISQKAKSISFTDCTNVAAYTMFNIDTIYSFDRFYTKQGLNVNRNEE